MTRKYNLSKKGRLQKIKNLGTGMLNKSQSDYQKQRMSEIHKGKIISKEQREQISKTNKNKGIAPPKRFWFKKGCIPWNKEIQMSEVSNKTRKKLKIATSRFWSNPENKNKRVKQILKGLLKRPTSLEKGMIKIIEKNNLPYKYVGNGSLIIGGKNPDFIHKDKKILIEVGNVFHHQGNYKIKRKEHFKNYGYRCYVFIQDKLNEKFILDKLGEST